MNSHQTSIMDNDDNIDQQGPEDNGGGDNAQRNPVQQQQRERVQIGALRVPFPTMHDIAQIELWFVQMQCWFDLNQVRSDNSKYNMVVAHLKGDVLAQVEDVLRAPPAQEKFNAIKNALVSRFADSERTRVHKLVSGITLGDKKPSHLLQELRRANVGNDETLLKTMWLSRLPTSAQATLSIAHGTLQEVANLADIVIETLRIGNHGIVAQVGQAAQYNGTPNDNRVDELIKVIAELKAEVRTRGRSQSRASGGGRDKTPAKEYDICWFHYKFGAKAKKCGKQADPPKQCKWTPKN